MKLRSFMLIGLTRCLCKYLFCSQKAYAGNACLVISKSTLLKLSIVRIPISRTAWLKIAFSSPAKNLTVKVYLRGPLLMLWPSKALSSLSFQTSHSSGSRRCWSHRILSHYHLDCYDTWSLCTSPFWEPSQAAFPSQWLGPPMEIAFELFSWQFSCWMIFTWKLNELLSQQSAGSNVTMPHAEIGASLQQ